MKIVHTSDWHAGRSWKNINRRDELEAVLQNLGDFLEREKVELLLVSGDVFDTTAPSADAEHTVFSFFKRIGRAGIKSVVIAGNHDSPQRLRAWGTLAELVDVHTVALPCRADQGGVVRINGAVVAALPFAPVHRLISGLDLAGDDTMARQKYADGMRVIVAHLAERFRGDTVNLFMAHTHLEGAIFANSERTVHLGDEWAATAQILPASAHYVALGHIHNPQRVHAAPVPAYYAGSPMQLDFGEVTDEKTFVVIDARPGQPARMEHVPYVGAKRLIEHHATLDEIERDAERLRDLGWLRVHVSLDGPDPDVAAQVRRLLTNALVVRAEYPVVEAATVTETRSSLSPADQYRSYYQSRYNAAPADRLLEAFVALYEEQDRAAETPG